MARTGRPKADKPFDHKVTVKFKEEEYQIRTENRADFANIPRCKVTHRHFSCLLYTSGNQHILSQAQPDQPEVQFSDVGFAYHRLTVW